MRFWRIFVAVCRFLYVCVGGGGGGRDSGFCVVFAHFCEFCTCVRCGWG